MREVGLAVIATLVLVVLGTHVFGGPIPMMWVHAMAPECDVSTHARRCVDTVAASVTQVSGDEVTLSAPSLGTLRVTGAEFTRLTGSVRVGVVGREVLWMTGADGKRVEALSLSAALLRFALVSAVAIALVSTVGWWRRGTWWVRPAAGSVAIGALLGTGAAAVAGRDLAMPVLFGVTALGSLGAAYVWVVYVHPAVSRT